jgi:peroxiredoxin
VHAVQLGLVSARLASLDTALLVLVPGSPEQARKIAKLIRASFPVLADPDHGVFRSFGLGRRLLLIQRSGSALVDRDGTLVYVRRSTSPRGALDLEALMAAVDLARHERSTA